MTAAAGLHEHLASRLGPNGWSTDADILAPHLHDWRGKTHGASPFLAMPASTEEVADIVRLCAEAGAAITPQGGNTGLVAAGIPQGEILLSTKRLNRIRSVSALDDALTAEAGAVLTAVQEAARAVGRLFPLSLGSQGSATIGGLLSTNAGGVHVVRYGMMRDLTLGLEVVLADGRVLNTLRVLRKDNTGYDLKQAFIGGEGTLGIITAASLRLFPLPVEHVVAVAAAPSPEKALDLLHRLKATGFLSAFEIMNRLSVDLVMKNIAGSRDPLPGAPMLALIEFESVAAIGLVGIVEAALAEAIEAGDALDAAIAQTEAQARGFWAVRETIPVAHRGEGAQINLDISVPVSSVPWFLAQAETAVRRRAPGARIVAFGHAGDGNIHYAVMSTSPEDGAAFGLLLPAIQQDVQDVAAALGGSISAEHGIGVARRQELARYKSPEALATMAAIKAALDPQRIMNPRALT